MMESHHVVESHHKGFHIEEPYFNSFYKGMYNMMEAHHMMNFHHMMELHHVMGFHHCVIRQINFSCALHYAWKVIHLYNFHDELGEATVCGKHRLADLGDDQYGLDHPAAAADGDPSCFWDLQQLFLANWCLQVGWALQLLGAHFA